ncbi:LexA family protein [Xanthocytophaga flava]|uniref:LexA family protein n=1 Tax=Xanthocytophaga flava TaxID=3048013 RepID=UPI0028D05787|nr:translesion error-prone DNA polymerase V autoproteolytic subunit [Xanthocytophaga flavus]MDJ1472821.1 translesion error-prone DNA polymerase V autoproteolytic subunit [Xanthocytophaga flavus]
MNAKPISRIQRIDFLPANASKVIDVYKPLFHFRMKLPLYQSRIQAGYPSPADDHLDKELDLMEKLIQNKQSTFYLQVTGDSMKGCGIFDGSIVIVDRSLKAKDGKIVIAVVNGEFTCKRLKIENRLVYLCAENKDYQDILVTEDMNFRVWGVVTATVTSF